MRTKFSARYHSGLLGALAKGDVRPDSEEELEVALRAGGSRALPSVVSQPPEGPEDVGGAGSGSVDYAESGQKQAPRNPKEDERE